MCLDHRKVWLAVAGTGLFISAGVFEYLYKQEILRKEREAVNPWRLGRLGPPWTRIKRTTMTQQELLQDLCVSLNEEDSARFRGLFELGIIKFELRQDGDINLSLTCFGRLVLAQIRKESIS